jgi:hypothetical protein
MLSLSPYLLLFFSLPPVVLLLASYWFEEVGFTVGYLIPN